MFCDAALQMFCALFIVFFFQMQLVLRNIFFSRIGRVWDDGT